MVSAEGWELVEFAVATGAEGLQAARGRMNARIAIEIAGFMGGRIAVKTAASH